MLRPVWTLALWAVLVVPVSVVGCRERAPSPHPAPPVTAAPLQAGDDGHDGRNQQAGDGDDVLPALHAALGRAARYLVAAQGDDGAFRSTTYAAFADGYSLTPLVVTALLMTPESALPTADRQPAYRGGIDFVATLVTADGKLRTGLDGPRYPYYAISTVMLALHPVPGDAHARTREVLMQALLARQLVEDRGFEVDDLSYGGWGYDFAPSRGGERPAANLSATLFAIGALRLGGLAAEHPALRKARTFVERCQNFRPADETAPMTNGNADGHIDGSADDGTVSDMLDDGGFFFSPVVADGNKAGPAGPVAGGANGRPRYKSYGSMTADGVRALMQLGLPVDHVRVRAASSWLQRHFDAAQNPGDFPENARIRQASAYFYYAWSVAHAMRALGLARLRALDDRHWAQVLVRELLRRQRDDGSFSNRYTELREDDPLLATPMAMAALAVARLALTGQYDTHSVHRPGP